MSRRGFLIGAGVLGGGVALGYVFGVPALHLSVAERLDGGEGQPNNIGREPSVWIEIAPNNQATFYIPKIEMGQGVHTALAQIMAEELEVKWDDVKVVQANTTHGPVDGAGTTGSTTVSSMYSILREVAANMREMLRAEAASQLGKAPSDLIAANGAISSKDKTISRTYGEIVLAKQGKWEAPKEKPALKPVSEFSLIGQPMQRVDLPDKVMGEAVYGYDARLPNMLYGAFAQPPSIGATLKGATAGEAATLPGVVKVLIEKDFVGVAAESRQAARAAIAAMTIEWQERTPAWQQADIDAMVAVREGEGTVIQNDGDAQKALTAGAAMRAQFNTPMAAHAHLEPQAALADVTADKARIWVSTQMPSLVRGGLASALGLKEDQIEINPMYVGGGFGRKVGVDAAAPAARLSRATGRPVHVGWVRQEEFQNGYLRPPTAHVLKGIVAADGKIGAMEHQQSSGEVAAAFLPAIMMAVFGSDFGAWRGARIHYGVPNRRTTARVVKLPLQTGWWRGLGLLANIFAIESFVDEMAASVKMDPLAFRLKNLPDGVEGERFRTALQTVADKAGWGTPAPQGRARGIACCTDGRTIVAQVAEVSINEQKNIRVHKVHCAIDPGLVINPDGVKAQSEGAITMGLSSVLFEEARVEDGKIHARNFDAYPVITMRDTPEIEVTVLSSGEKPYGVGEPPIGPVAAAVANAVFALTGQRLRSLPLRLNN